MLLFGISLRAQFVLFPGDANNDGVANHYDLLPIGVAFGAEGFPRIGATLDWQPQFMPDPWFNNLPVSGINYAFVDCNGDMFVDSVDIEAIAFNFDSIQFESQPPPLPYHLPDTCFSCPKPDLVISFDRDTAMVTDTFFAVITLVYPDEVPPEIASMGIAFDLNYDPENVKDSLTKVFPDTMPGDLMFVAATTALADEWRSIPPGNIGFGASGKAKNTLFKPRELGKVAIVVDDMIIRSQSTEALFWIDPSNILLINKDEQVVGLGEVVVDTILLFDPASPVAEVESWKSKITLLPNPAADWVRIHSPGAMIRAVEVFDENGRSVFIKRWLPGHIKRVELNCLAAGAYFIKIKTERRWVSKKLLIK
jgi:type IX secretion system substrate protein